MSTKPVDSGRRSLQHVASLWDEGEFSDSISQYEVERIDSRAYQEKESTRYLTPVLYEKLKLKVTTCAGRSFEKELVFSTCFTPRLTDRELKETLKLPFDRFSKKTEQPYDFYSLKKDILEKLKSRTSIYTIDECHLVRQKYLSELFPKN